MLAALILGQQAIRTTTPIDVPKFAWTEAGVPYDQPGGPPQRHLVLSNGPEQIGAWCFPNGATRANLYWGAIAFEGTSLRLRVYIDHLIDPAGPIDDVDIRFGLGIKGGGVRIVRRVSTLAYTPPNEPRQYIDPGQKLAFAHLAQRWQTSSTKVVPVPEESESGDVSDFRMKLQRQPEHRHYGNLVGEIDLLADKPVPGRKLIVRTVATLPGAELGTMAEETCVDAGAGERGWWPKADVWVRGDAKNPIPIPGGGFFHVIGPQALEWSQFNRLDEAGKRISNNAQDRFGTKNSGLWGVNILYRVYVRGTDRPTTVKAGLAGWLKDVAAGHAVSGPFSPADNPWYQYNTGRLRVGTPQFLNRRSPNDYDFVDLGFATTALAQPKYFEYFVANAGASVLPSALVVKGY